MSRSDSSFEALDDQDCRVCGFQFDLEAERCPSCGTLVDSGAEPEIEPTVADQVPMVSNPRKQPVPTTKDVPTTDPDGSSASLDAISSLDGPAQTTEMDLATGIWRVMR